MKKEPVYNWLKAKAYLHVTSQLNLGNNPDWIINRVTSEKYVSKYAFFPLIHSIIYERKYKLIEYRRTHSYRDDNGVYKKTIKSRPLHYATHMDALIFGYYAELLQFRYEDILKRELGLSDSIIAYRRIPIGDGATNKSTIHFAHEVFGEIKRRSEEKKQCAVLAFDIKSFFSSLNHTLLLNAWAELLGVERLPDDHYNVFRASTSFSYIMKDDLRKGKGERKGRKNGFDEKELARIRNVHGINSYFESPKVFRDKIKSGELRVYKYPFWNKEENKPMGIPQGLPISAILANLYLLEFDKRVLDYVVSELGGFYRRYSDDIAVVCDWAHMELVEAFISNEIKKSKLNISVEKTEKFHFKFNSNEHGSKLTSILISNDGAHKLKPFIYLGFEFNGRNILIKSTNLSKFYRRMIDSVKRKAKRAKKISQNHHTNISPVVYRRQLYKLYSLLDLDQTKVHIRWKRLVKSDCGRYRLVTGKKAHPFRSNYFSYVKRASAIMNEPKIENQIKKHKKIFNESISKHLTK